MSIEEAIKQKKFVNPYHKLGVNLIYTSNWLMHQQQEALRAFDLSPQQYNVLRILRGAFPLPMRVSAICERMLDKTSNASRLVDKLLAKNLLTRKSCPSDRRAVNVVISEEGFRLLQEADQVIAVQEEALHNLTPEEALSVSDMLDTIRQANSR